MEIKLKGAIETLLPIIERLLNVGENYQGEDYSKEIKAVQHLIWDLKTYADKE